MKISLLITTYERPEMLSQLISDIKKNQNKHSIDILIIDDCSKKDYSDVINQLDICFPGKYEFLKADQHQGKAYYWRLIDLGYSKLKNKKFDYLIQVPDDIRLKNNFFEEAISAYESINCSRKACLNILADRRSFMRMWTTIKPVLLNDKIIKTGWVDMAYICKKRFLSALQYQIIPIETSWSGNKRKSSGVGMQISRRLFEQGFTMFQVVDTLIEHDDHPSVMHPKLRKEQPIVSKLNQQIDMKERIIASMATMPSREISLEETVNSIINQVDQLDVYLNEYDHVPKFLNNPKINIFRSQDELGDIGDAGKFYTANQLHGYHLTIDDDLIYPPTYVADMIKAIEESERKCIITLHGRRFDVFPIASYYYSSKQRDRFACLRDVNRDEFLHVGGSGVMAYHTNTIRFDISDFKLSNMADIWVGIKAQECKIPILCKAHKKGYIKESQAYNKHDTIFSNCHKSDKPQTDIMNSIEWDLNVV